MISADFAVLGAGPAGLGAAHQLAGRGFEVVVVEQAGRVGGLAGSHRVADQSVDHGSHRLHGSTPAPILRLLSDLLGPELQTRRRRGRIRIANRWLTFPLSPGDVVRTLPAGFLARLGFGAGAAILRRRDDTTLFSFIKTGLGRTIGDVFYFPYARKIWGIEPDRLSGEQARRRITSDTPWKLLRRVATSSYGSGDHFFYPAGGFGRIPEILAEAATARGVGIRLGDRADAVRLHDSGVTIRTGQGMVIEAKNVWSSIPLTRLAAMVDTAPSPPRLDYRSMILVYLVVPLDRYTGFDAHYFPEPDIALTRLSEPKNYRDGDDPVGQTVLCAELPCFASDETWSWDDDDLGRFVSEALIRSGLPDPRPIHVQTRRVRAAYPVYRMGFEDELRPILDWVGSQPRALTLGRQGLFAHDNTHHALAMAWAAADSVHEDGSLDERRWAAHVASFGEHVVED